MTSREEAIRRRAYAIWEEQGRPDGRHEEHWRAAEIEIERGAALPGKPARKKPAPKKPASELPAGTKPAPARGRKARLSEPEGLALAKAALAARDA